MCLAGILNVANSFFSLEYQSVMTSIHWSVCALWDTVPQYPSQKSRALQILEGPAVYADGCSWNFTCTAWAWVLQCSRTRRQCRARKSGDVGCGTCFVNFDVERSVGDVPTWVFVDEAMGGNNLYGIVDGWLWNEQSIGAKTELPISATYLGGSQSTENFILLRA